jgi:catechol 2,3-dioxygenase-like lactoylglutathione lyase family enzyme
VALVCSDMEKTVELYSNVLGMPLIKSLDLPDGMGQHFFFDAGNGDSSLSSGSPRRRIGCRASHRPRRFRGSGTSSARSAR